MELKINGDAREVDDDEARTVADLMQILGVERARGVAVAVNHKVIPRSRWHEVKLSDGDGVEIIRATQGG